MESKEMYISSRDQLSDEIDILEVIAAIWSGRLLILFVVIVFGFLAALYSLSLPNKYTAEALLAPRTDSGAGGALGQMASQFSGLAGLAGVNIGGLGDQNSTAIAIEMLKSREFFRRYLYDSILVDLFAAKGFDQGSGEVVLNDAVYDKVSGDWLLDGGNGSLKKPSVQEAHQLFVANFFKVIEDKKTGFVTVAVTHFSPTVARDWVTLLVTGVNDAVRAKDVEEAEKSIEFLNDQRLKVNLVSLTQVFAELIEQQTKTVMLANASDEYVFQIIDPPVAPELKSSPQRALICILVMLFGGLFAVIAVLGRYFITKSASAQ